MNIFTTLALIACIAFLTSCSGTSNTIFFNSSNQSNSNVSVDVPGVKVKSNDNSKNIKVLGVTVKNEDKHNTIPTASDTRHFLNGDACKNCDYIGRTENNDGHWVEAEIVGGFRNGEEREYLDGEVIRSSYYVNGGKSGMEYIFSHGTIIDSAYIETTDGSSWDPYRIKTALPYPVSIYIYNLILGDPDAAVSITTTNGKITTIYKKKATDTTGASKAATVEYERYSNLSNFKVNITNPFPETMVFIDNELIERHLIQGGQTVFEFKKDSIVNELFPDGKTATFATGNVNYSLIRMETTCSGECHISEFFENGVTKEESFYFNGKPTKTITRNENNIVLFDFDYPNYFKLFYDDGTLREFFQGEFANDAELTKKKGIWKSFYPNGNLAIESTYEDGKIVKTTIWYENGKPKLETDYSSYQRNYYENGQLTFESIGVIESINGVANLLEGTEKNWYENGTLQGETIFKNGVKTTMKYWDSTGVLKMDFQRMKHLITEISPTEHMEYVGDIIYDKEEYECTGFCTKKTYQGNILIYKEKKEGVDPSTGKFKKVSVDNFDSTGKKISHEEYLLDQLVIWKKYFPENEAISHDFNINSHFKVYYKPKKLSLDFKGKTDNKAKYIEGTEIQYYESGKKRSESKWKNSKAVSLKNWDEKGLLISDFVLDKYAIFYYPGTKKKKQHFEGKIYYSDDQQYVPMDGVLKTFDESGNLVRTYKYTSGNASYL